ETIVDLAIGKFELQNASLSFGDRKTQLNVTGENLRAQLGYNPLHPEYTGELSMSPINLQTAGQAPLKVDMKLPVKLEKDKVTLTNAEFHTPESKVIVSGYMDHLVAPRMNARINAMISIEEAPRMANLSLPLDLTHGPKTLNADVIAAVDEQNRIQIQNAKINLGASNIEASGTPNAVQFTASVALGEIGRLFRVEARPEGTAHIGGNATLGPNNDYKITANVDARNVGLRQGSTHITGVSLDSSVTADPHRIELGGLRLAALGGSFAGSGGIEDMARFHVSGNLRNFDIAQLSRVLMGQPLGYDGVISGPVAAQGNLKDSAGLVAKAALAIAPGRRGVPVSGKLNVDYNARADTVTLGRSYLTLPSTRVDLSGGLRTGREQGNIQVHLVSRNLDDFKPVAGAIPVKLIGGTATVDATVSGKLSDPHIGAQASVTRFMVEDRQFTNFTAAL